MRRTLLLASLLLSSCAPILSAVQQSPATLTTDGATLLLANKGTEAAEDAVMVLSGPVTVTGAACTLASRSWVCPVGDIPAGQGYRLAFTGTLNNANATFYTLKSGNRPVYLQLH